MCLHNARVVFIVVSAMHTRLVKIFLALLMLAVLGVCYQQLSSRTQTRVAPDFALPTPQAEQKITLRQYRGQAVLLNFFATWCHNCRAEKKFLQALRHQHADLPIVSILTFDADADLSSLQAPTVAIDHDGAVARRYGVRWLPQTFLIAADGRIVQHFTQPLNASRYAALTSHLATVTQKSVH